MKKILFGSAAAICVAVGFSSFKTMQKKDSLYYFEVPNDNITAGVGNSVTRAQASFLQVGDPGSGSCSTSPTVHDICIIDVTAGNITHLSGTGTFLKNSAVNATKYTRNAQ